MVEESLALVMFRAISSVYALRVLDLIFRLLINLGLILMVYGVDCSIGMSRIMLKNGSECGDLCRLFGLRMAAFSLLPARNSLLYVNVIYHGECGTLFLVYCYLYIFKDERLSSFANAFNFSSLLLTTYFFFLIMWYD